MLEGWLECSIAFECDVGTGRGEEKACCFPKEVPGKVDINEGSEFDSTLTK